MGGFLCAPGSKRRAVKLEAWRAGRASAPRRPALSRRCHALVASLAALGALAVLPAAASAGTPAAGEPFGLACETGATQSVEVEKGVTEEIPYEGGVRFCKGNGTTERVPSWDGVPLDVDVTLPPGTNTGPFPTIVMLHGYGGTKTEFEFPLASGDSNEIYDYNNDYFAQHGYAVVNYTARGFGESCGLTSTEADPGACAEHGFVHLADQRYEARDTQYLLGQLVEEGVAAAGKLGVTGISYGGGQTITLAYLKNRIRCAGEPDEAYDGPGANPCEGEPENALVPWETPVTKEPLEINAAYARWPWSDIANALVPNGRFLEYDPATYDQDGASGTESPIGVPLFSYQQALYSDGVVSAGGYYEVPSPTASLEWNLSESLVLFEHPEPENPKDQEVVNGLSAFHGGFAVPSGEAPAPLLMQSGWNDDLFPPRETLRVYNSVREKYPDNSFVALQYGDVGHSRGTDTPVADQYFDAQGAAFFEEKLLGVEKPKIEDEESGEEVGSPANGQATTFTTTCEPQTEAESGAGGIAPYVDTSSWQDLQNGVVELSGSAAQTVSNPASEDNEAIGGEFDPILQEEKTTPNVLSPEPETDGPCREIYAAEPEGTASYIEPVTEDFTMMGLPTISAKISVSGTEKSDGQIDARLWEIVPNVAKPQETTERLVSRGDFKLEEPQTPNVVFQLHGNGYTFEEGDAIKLELTTSEYPYYQSGTSPYSISVSDVHAYLPTFNSPGTGTLVKKTPSSLPTREKPIVKPTEKVEEKAGAKEEKLVQTLPAKTTEPAPQCLTSWPVTIKLPKYKKSKITKAVIMFKGKKVKTVKSKSRSIRSISYTISGTASNTTTLKLKLSVKARTGKIKTKKLSRSYHLCM
jgi:predicted acyl esterase